MYSADESGPWANLPAVVRDAGCIWVGKDADGWYWGIRPARDVTFPWEVCYWYPDIMTTSARKRRRSLLQQSLEAALRIYDSIGIVEEY